MTLLKFAEYFVFVQYLFFLKLSTEQGNFCSGEFSVRKSSENLTVVAQGQPLQLNITLNGTDAAMPMLVFLDWNFRPYFSSIVKRLLSVTWDRGLVVSQEFHEIRASIFDGASLLLVDTKLKDSGTYWCNVFSLPSQHYPVLYFNVTVQGKPKAQIQCSEKANVTEGKNFSCWCRAQSAYLTPSVWWIKPGAARVMERMSATTSVELLLHKVRREMAGTYICRAQLYSMVDETELTLSVLYAPIIRSFRGKVLKDDSMILTCLADGLPRPTYMIKISNGITFTAGIQGMVVISDYRTVVNASYTCIAKNSVGEDIWHLNGLLTISKDEEKQGPLFENYVWYIIACSIIVGIILGFLLLKVCQSTLCRRSGRDKKDDEQVNNSPVYVDPVTLPVASWKKDPLKYVDVHVLSSIEQGGVGENLPVYIDPDTVVPAREQLRRSRLEIQVQSDAQATEIPVEANEKENNVSDDEESSANEAVENADNNESEEKFEADHKERQSEPSELRPSEPKPSERRHSEPKPSEPKPSEPKLSEPKLSEPRHSKPVPAERRPAPRPNARPKPPRAIIEPMQGYQDLDSGDEIEENFYHSLRSASEGQPITEYYVNERVKVTE